MSVNVMQLLDDLEVRIERAQRLINVLEAQNRQLTQQLAENALNASHASEHTSDSDASTLVLADKPPTSHELLNQWYERYPLAFFKGHTKPLKVGIHQDLADREPWSNKLIRRALANYVNLPRYIKAMREGAERIDLEGNVAGVVDSQAAAFAANKRKPKDSADAGSVHDKRKRSKKAVSGKQCAANKDRVGRKSDRDDPLLGQKVSETYANPSPEPTRQDSSLSMEEKLANLQAKFRVQ